MLKKLLNWLASHVVAKVIVGLILIVFAISAVIVNHDELAIKTRFGENVGGPLNEGLTFIFPFMDEIRRYDTTIQFLLITDKTVSDKKTFEEVLYNEGVSVTSEDRVDAKLVFEIAYQIQKDSETVNMFVSTFGRVNSDVGTEKIEKLIADSVRLISRSVLARAKFHEAESNALYYSSLIANMANGATASIPQQYQDVSESLQRPTLRDLGIRLQKLGYRIQANQDFRTSRQKLAIELDEELNRKQIIQAKAASDLLESERLKKDAESRIDLAELKKKEFDALPDATIEKLSARLVEKWDGVLPRSITIGSNDSINLLQEVLGKVNGN